MMQKKGFAFLLDICFAVVIIGILIFAGIRFLSYDRSNWQSIELIEQGQDVVHYLYSSNTLQSLSQSTISAELNKTLQEDVDMKLELYVYDTNLTNTQTITVGSNDSSNIVFEDSFLFIIAQNENMTKFVEVKHKIWPKIRKESSSP